MEIKLLLYLAFLSSYLSSSYPANPENNFYHGPLQKRSLITRSSNLAPIRLTPYYIDFGLTYLNSEEFLKTILFPYLKKYFESRLQVYRVENNLVLDFPTCAGKNIPIEHQTLGIENTDIIIYFYPHNSVESSLRNISGICGVDTYGKKNPIAILFGINFYVYETSSFIRKFYDLFHGIYHLIGIAEMLKKDWIDPSGNPYSEIIIKMDIRGSMRNFTKTPEIVAKAKEAFACDTLNAVENDVYDNNHWSSRILFYDIMSGYSWFYEELIFSTITLAALQDTGWYKVNYEKLDIPNSSRKLGCSFLNTPCISNQKSNFPHHFCDKTDTLGCTTSKRFKAKCSMFTYENALPSVFQYFSDPKVGGYREFDYCPIWIPYKNGFCSSLNALETLTDIDRHEFVGANSRCFVSTLSRTKTFTSGAACYEVVNCSSTDATVKVENQFFSCPFTGGEVVLAGYNGKITCPDSDILCADVPCRYGCFGQGICIKGLCECDHGFSGDYCEILCEPSCMRCNKTNCLSCDFFNYQITGKICECLPGFTKQPDGNCCIPKCQLCNETACLICENNFTPINESCSCISRHYISISEETNEEICLPCGLFSCDLCNSTHCLKCLPGSQLQGPFCICSLGYAEKDDDCVRCKPHCQECLSDNYCIVCDKGYFVTYDGNCQECLDSCLICLPSKCQKCKDNFFLADGKCLNGCDEFCINCSVEGKCLKCITGYTLSLGFCLECPSFCDSCISKSKCITCSANFSLSLYGTCLHNCPNNCINCDVNDGKCLNCFKRYYREIDGNCYPCSQSCLNCLSSNTCLTCIFGFTLKDGICLLNCPRNCKVCSSVNQCLQCETGFNLNKKNLCISECPFNCKLCNSFGYCNVCEFKYFEREGKCFACSDGCDYCKDEFSCRICIQGYFSSDSKCSKCESEGCIVCNSVECLICEFGYSLKSGKCLKEIISR